MERAAKFIRKNAYSNGIFTDDDFARAIWPAAVGKAIAAHTARLKLVRTTLVVEMEDAMWRKQLFPLTRQILDCVRKVTGSDLVQDIEFRVAVPRRQPMRAQTPDSLAPPNGSSIDSLADEADSIRDPVLKKVYRLSRKKATA